MLKRKPLISLAAVAFFLAATWLIWKTASQRPLYSQAHRHQTEDGHTHTHSHDGETDHGHQHVGLLGTTSHSHPHEHAHRHDQPSKAVLDRGLELLAHEHVDGGVVQYFGKATISEDSIRVSFFCDRESRLAGITPSKQNAEFQIFNGLDVQHRLDFEREESCFIGKLPAGFVHLPTQTIRLRQFELGEIPVDATIPLHLSPAKTQ